jgi:hypothetical protein
MRIAMDSKNIFACACILTNWTDSASIASFTTLCLRQYKLSVSSTNYTNYINVILDAYRDYIDSNVTTRAYLFVFGVVFGKFKCSEESIIINTVKTMF